MSIPLPAMTTMGPGAWFRALEASTVSVTSRFLGRKGFRLARKWAYTSPLK